MKEFRIGIVHVAIACVVAIPLFFSSRAYSDDSSTLFSFLPFLNDAKFYRGAFVDTYYAYDFNNPPNHDRVLVNSGENGITNTYVTTASRSNEFNLNLAYLEGGVVGNDYRGRLALQAGTSVEANMANQPNVGSFGNFSLLRNTQEASIGYHVTSNLWIDVGIFPSYIGLESFISNQNWTYTRSLSADATPYFENGVKATYTFSDQITAQFHVMNGWNNLSEDNGNKAIGLQITYTPNTIYSITYNNYYGLMAPGNNPRFFNQWIGKVVVNPSLQLAANFDLGFQEKADQSGMANWHDVTFLVRQQLTAVMAASFRLEDFVDPYQLDVTTETPNGFQTWGYSGGLDVALKKAILWRTEFRELFSRDDVFPGNGKVSSYDPLVVTSLSLEMK
jgi:hypothetical protein